MLKIYHVYSTFEGIKVEDNIKFEFGKYDTGVAGFGYVNSANASVEIANYDLETLKSFKEYLTTIKNDDGFVKNFFLNNPFSLDELNKKYDGVSLDEEAILLFTNYITLKYPNDNSVQRIFGRYPDNGMYIVMPNATLEMTKNFYPYDNLQKYEVLQSNSVGKELHLTKMNRR